MAQVQKYFDQFDQTIKLRNHHEYAVLAEKRKNILNRLNEGIAQQRKAGAPIPAYRPFNQGSYDIGTGVKPIPGSGGEYDIDVGIEFDVARDAHPSVAVKTWVLNAVAEHTSSVEMRTSCVTVTYMESGKPKYHVDLAVYSSAARNPDRRMYLARGKPHASKEAQTWDLSAPEALTDLLNDRFTGDQGNQFRQAVRALKRWKDHRFPAQGHMAPRGIALAVAVFHWFSPMFTYEQGAPRHDILTALVRFVETLLSQFRHGVDAKGQASTRLQVCCPAEPHDDLCCRMSAEQMKQFHARLETLLSALRAAQTAPDAKTACETLRKEFGNDFPLP
ncbi:cyclic GMP-AMP synthase DncV-like nucleotidyltransferase [Chondromyces apiculatus]|uniref:Cyclic GMP-AMP synthase n=1 Tax=Chondromyces apiculatus DSM 436 TaxID=1192034 RepID=A0A017T955_9BACT|nr:hypothetical protein [Chondromyces apiculatus]EYF05350.1 Hypothetical protein CAP_3267 [Chondromyces apiculatus DSM 436]